MPRDLERKKEWMRLYRDKRMVEKYGPAALGQNMRGLGHHAQGPANAKWRGGRFITSQGYVAVRVPPNHPHAWGWHPEIKYAYEHILVMEAHIGRQLTDDEIVHHGILGKHVNRIENLELQNRSVHSKNHASKRSRDAFGRFTVSLDDPLGFKPPKVEP